jgi:gamma-glutamyl hercynylcysteine S-oxide synthase
LKSLAPPDMVLVAAGSFQMGSERFANEAPLTEAWVNSFYLSRFPVTNNHYYEFIQSGGYNKEQYWTKNGWLWVQAYGRRRPLNWEDDLRLNEGNHPVQWLTWYEAMAYVRSLALTTGAPYRLPTEIEWEKAASWEKEKSTKREYPWGNEFDFNCCNVKRTENAVSWSEPVGGRSPAGDSPYGLADMAGQVWEWVSSMRKPYPYDPDDGREDPESEGERVFRGGSWANVGSYVARTTCRYYPHLVIMPYINTTKDYDGPCGLRVALGFTGRDGLD